MNNDFDTTATEEELMRNGFELLLVVPLRHVVLVDLVLCFDALEG